MLTLINLTNTFYSFYVHNWQLVYFGGCAVFCFLRLVIKPSRYYAILLLGFLSLLFEFEYTKHLIPHVRENVTELVLVDPARRSFGLTDMFFSKLFPLGLQVLGWFLVFISVFVLHRDRD
ncbi:hypothetical protein HY419_01835 [candidate division WWE3 bacterium]|nr:hypothetical protein [candidate division WWE3 bacterium]